MAEENQDTALREAARARGFRLVKSRRRKPGGDFGRYGLVGLDSGRECLGFGADGLTATAEEVHAYLRGGEVASWKRSLIGVGGEGEGKPSRERARAVRADPTQDTERRTSSPSATSRRGVTKARLAPPASPPAFTGVAGVRPSSPDKAVAEAAIREATRRDAAALAKLTQIHAATLAERIAAAIQAGEPPLVATGDGDPVGLVAWTILSTLHEGPRGRVTLLLVAEGERRQGIGTSLLAAAQQRLVEAGVTEVELLLDIDFDAPSAFLRRTSWARTTNGYGKQL